MGESMTEARLPTNGAPDHGVKWSLEHRLDASSFADQLEEVAKHFETNKIDVPINELAIALLALSVRQFVLLAGPPGCGKSSLVRTIAYLLGKSPGPEFIEVSVQAHWLNDRQLFRKKGPFGNVSLGASPLVLFDEFNLARPEYYLSRLFHTSDVRERGAKPAIADFDWRAFGTLNIDETSRPPSAKVVDRCMLLELDQVDHSVSGRAGIDLKDCPKLAGLPSVPEGADAELDPVIEACLAALADSVKLGHLRHDLLPSRRVMRDIHAMLALHRTLDLENRGLLTRNEVVDRLLASRVLVKISGAYEQVEPALTAIESSLKGFGNLAQTQRRLQVARRQRQLGFVSPWQ